MTTKKIKARLEYLRGELRGERISYGELHELQSLASHIEPGDVELLEPAGVPEFSDQPPETTMKIPTLEDAVLWIVHEDAPGDNDNVEALAGYLTVALVADLFGVEALIVAKAVWQIRNP